MEIIEKTLLICDDMLKANVTRRLIEQYAFSVALSDTTTLLEAQTQIAHYWSNKEEWNKLINDFFIDHYLKKSSKEEVITVLHEMIESYLEALRIYKNPDHLSQVPLSHPDDQRKWSSIGVEVFNKLSNKASKIVGANYYAEAQLPA